MTSIELSIRSWRRALSPHARKRSQFETQSWVHRFQAAYTTKDTMLSDANGLLNAALPFADLSRRYIREKLTLTKHVPSSPDRFEHLISSLEASLFDRLFGAVSKTLVLELGTAAKRKLLVGKTKEARFKFFCDCLADPEFSGHLLAQYPCLVRRLDTMIANWRNATEELIVRLDADFMGIRSSLFSGTDLGALVGVKELGDCHAAGRTVGRLSFESGQTIIYKPRSVAMEFGFHTFVNWLNDAGLSPDLMAARVVDRDGYGWVTNIDPAPCSDVRSVKRFFHREGQNLALMYVLGATDLHYENVIAAGEYPVVVDLETLFQGTPKAWGMSKAGATAYDLLVDSVMRTLLLPTRISSQAYPEESARSVDISALGYAAGEESPFLVQDWDKWETDNMQLRDRREVMPMADCLPELDGQRISASIHIDEIASGLSNAYDFLEQRKQTLRSRSGPLAIFKNGTNRHVFRATAQYAQLLANSWHPGFGHDAARLENHLKDGLGALDKSILSQRSIVNAELTDLTAGDIPYFRAQVSGRKAFSPTRPNAAIVLGADGWKACQRHIDRLSPSDKERQIWLARMAFVDLDAPLVARPAKQAPFKPKQLLEAATRIGDRLCDLAVRKDNQASWLFPLIENKKHIVPAVVGFDLYNGLSGIGLFLGYLSKQTRSRRHQATAIAAIHEALSIYRRVKNADKPVGAYEGAAGLAYVLAHLGPLLKKPGWSRQAVKIIRAEILRAKGRKAIDLISGQAGLLLAGVAVAQITGKPELLTVLRPIARSVKSLRDRSLPPDGDAGLAHGKAGIGLALGRWAAATGDETALARSLALLKDDLTATRLARRKTKSSRDLDTGAAMTAWCRGGIGAALATVQLGYPVGQVIKHTIRDAFEDLKKSRATDALCLCHGSLGVVECLNLINVRGQVVTGRRTSTLPTQSLNRVLNGEYCADHAHRLDAPGLMVGMAGTGYALLRALEPRSIPSVLTLAAN